jgi:predicted TIM-barrel fold metal-dependent hydrolase
MNRRESLLTLAGGLTAAAQTKDPIVETHVHLFSDNLSSFPGATGWKVLPSPLEKYLQFAKQAGISHAIHVSAEPYQNDLRYLEHTLDSAPKGFLKGTLLLDPILDETPKRMTEYVKRHRGQIVAMRIHCTRGRDVAPTTSGPLRDRDLLHPGVRRSWKTAGELGIAVQAHIQPWFAPLVAKHASELPATRVIIDHFGHAGVSGAIRTASGEWNLTNGERGYRDPADFQPVLELAKFPNVIFKVSGLQYSSREAFPHTDIKPLARKAFDAFGPDRMVWGSLGASLEQFKNTSEIFNANFDFLSAADRAKIQGLTAKRLFSFT